MDLPSFWVYVLFSLHDYHFYLGTTSNLLRRLGQHEQGESVSTRSRRPFILSYVEGHCSIIDARRREKYFKTDRGRTMLKYIIRDSLDQPQIKR